MHDSPDGAPHARAGCGVWGVVAIVAAVLLLGAGAYLIVTRVMNASKTNPAAAAAAAKNRPVPVAVAKVVRGDMNLYLTGLGNVTPLNNVTVRSRVDGQIMKVAFIEGQNVQEGQLLAQIDPRPYQVQLEQAQGQLQKDQASLTNAQLDLQRYQSIKGSVTQQQIDTQTAAVAQAQGVVESDKSQVDSAKLNLSFCEITAPITGRIGLRVVDVGNIVHANDVNGIAVVAQIQPITVVFTVPEDQISEVFRRPDHGQGLPVDAFNSDLSKKIATGKLSAIDNQVDPATGTVRIKAEFPNQDMALFPSQFVNARLLVNTLKEVVIVPSAAVQLGPQSTFVYVVKPDNTVELRTIEQGPKEGAETTITKGLQPGETVVTDGVDKLVQGTKVIPRKAGAEPGGATTRPAGASTRPARGNRPAAQTGPADAPDPGASQ